MSKIKNNKTKKIIIICFCVVLLMSALIPISLFCKHDGKYKETPKEKFLYTLVGNEIVIDAYNADDKIVVIPETIDSKLVTKIGINAFKNANIEKIIIGKNIKTIDTKAFQNCQKLQSITFSESVNFIGAYAFVNCESLKEIEFPKNIKYINKGVCKNCTSLKKVILNDDIEIIFEDAFNGTKISNIKLPIALKEIRAGAFLNCTQLNNINLPSRIKELSPTSFDFKKTNCNINNNKEIKQYIKLLS